MHSNLKASHQVIAHNDATDSGNPMHDDAAARAMNFKGALVPGVTVFGYMTRALLQHYGDSWLEGGCMQVRFRRPVYAGEQLEITCLAETAVGQSVVTLAVLNPDGDACVVGRASMAAPAQVVPRLPRAALPSSRLLPENKWPAERGRFASEHTFGSLNAVFAAMDADAFLHAMQDDSAIYRNGVTHPAWLLRQANLVVDRNVDIGPWIHVESEVQNFAMARNDERIEVRAQVMQLFEKNGHEYFDLDVAMLADGDPERLLMRVMHRAIYKMGSTAP
jgi:acyl dehydratase